MRYEGKHTTRKRRTRAPARKSAVMKGISVSLVAFTIVVSAVCFAKGVGSAAMMPDEKAEKAGYVAGGMEVSPSEVAVLKLAETVYGAEPPATAEPPEESEDPLEPEKIEAVLLEQGYFRDDVPLTYELQDFLHTACEEAGVPYALALAVIQRETQFRNIVGDDGASEGYMQVQERWHRERMERLGVTDLMDPFGNFRVGCDFLAELIDQYESVDIAVTVYNWGHNPGYITNYGSQVMSYYEQWRELVGDD